MEKTRVKLNRKHLYLDIRTGCAKLGCKSKCYPIEELFAKLGKGNARRIRQRLRSEGYAHLASLSAKQS